MVGPCVSQSDFSCSSTAAMSESSLLCRPYGSMHSRGLPPPAIICQPATGTLETSRQVSRRLPADQPLGLAGVGQQARDLCLGMVVRHVLHPVVGAATHASKLVDGHVRAS